MSRWISQEAERLAPYTPGEQPQDQQYVKLNTNESPFPPSPKVLKAINRAEILKLNLYSDPTCAALTEAIARRYELKAKNVLAGNGSDVCWPLPSGPSAERGNPWPLRMLPMGSISPRLPCSIWM